MCIYLYRISKARKKRYEPISLQGALSTLFVVTLCLNLEKSSNKLESLNLGLGGSEIMTDDDINLLVAQINIQLVNLTELSLDFSR